MQYSSVKIRVTEDNRSVFVKIVIFYLLFPVLLAAKPIEIWISSYQDKIYYQDMVKLYTDRVDKDFEANIHAYGFRELPDKFAVAIKTGVNPPDIIQLDEVLFGTYLAGKVPFVDLGSRVNSSGLNTNILESRLSLFSYKGKTYGLPQSLAAIVLYYRTDLFEEWEIDVQDLSTWNGFEATGLDLAENNQALIALDPSYFDILLRQKGSDIFDKEGNVFPDEELAIETFEWLHSIYEDGIGILPDRASIFDPVFFNSTVSYGEVLCIMGASWYGLDMIQQLTPELAGNWGVMPLPAWINADGTPGRRTSSFAGQGLMIYEKSKKIDDSWKFIEFVMTDKDANVRRFLNGNSFPAYKPAWKDKRMLAKSKFFNNQRLGKILVSLSSMVPPVVMHPKRPQAIFMIQENYFSSLIYGQMTAEEIVSEMKSLLEKQ